MCVCVSILISLTAIYFGLKQCGSMIWASLVCSWLNVYSVFAIKSIVWFDICFCTQSTYLFSRVIHIKSPSQLWLNRWSNWCEMDSAQKRQHQQQQQPKLNQFCCTNHLTHSHHRSKYVQNLLKQVFRSKTHSHIWADERIKSSHCTQAAVWCCATEKKNTHT